MDLRFLFYSPDGVGLGHVRRNLAIARALTAHTPEASILLATSADEAESFGVPPNVDVLRLPGLRKLDNEHYAARRLGVPSDDVRAIRSALLAAAVESFRPAVMLVDKHPLGVGGELRAALESLRAAGARAVLGLRDILDDRAAVMREWGKRDLARRIAEYYERVLVYGSPHVLDPIAEYRLPRCVAERTSFCGYVVNRPPDDGWSSDVFPMLATTPRPRPVVLATAGGGEDGFGLLKTFIEAAGGAPWDGIVVAGPRSGDEDLQTLRRMAAEAGVAFSTFLPDLMSTFAAVDALVSMGGYNTLTEAAASGVPTVCVPRVVPRTEQLIRARAFARIGLLRLVEPERLDARTLRSEVACTLASSRVRVGRRALAALGLDGAARAAGELLELADPSTRMRTRAIGVAG
ncbi:MAG TPA: glycosyltransferase [Gaiellaceae bacterium]